VINTNLPPILHRFRDIAFDMVQYRYSLYLAILLRLIPRWRSSLHHIIVSDISLKLDTLGYISVAESLGISSTTFTQCATKATDFSEITQNNGHYAVEGHSRSPILIESSCATSY